MSSKLYTTIPAPKVPRNIFNRTRPNSLTMPFQYCVPTMVEETLPGDFFTVGNETFARLQPMIAPVMNNMKISSHAFFVPLRTLNNHFAEFMFNNRTGDYSEVLPYVTTEDLFYYIEILASAATPDYQLAADVIRMYDFIGLPFKYSSANSATVFVNSWLGDVWNGKVSDSAKRVNLAPFFAYQKIWSEYFRDENVEDDPFIVFEEATSIDLKNLTGDVSQTLADYIADFCEFLRLRRRAWAHDRFTSALPFAQRGPDVLLPIAGTADVTLKKDWVGVTPGPGQDANTMLVTYRDGTPPSAQDKSYPFGIGGQSGTSPNLYNYVRAFTGADQLGSKAEAAIDPNGGLEVDFADAGLTTTINDFRRAERLQRWYENSARGGVRPNEATLAHFGVKTLDATLDRAEFLGGQMQPIVVSEVTQTSSTDVTSPQGNLAGKGTSYKGSRLCKAYFTEHGFLMVLTSALVRANYWQGIPKMFSRMQRDEYYWPEFANLGEEPVYTKELYAGDDVTEDEVFGYVPRYSDYKSAVGEVHGDMRSSLSFWTQTREFSNEPKLNKHFLFGDPSLSPFAVASYFSDPLIVTINFNVQASRLMPFYGVPTI